MQDLRAYADREKIIKVKVEYSGHDDNWSSLGRPEAWNEKGEIVRISGAMEPQIRDVAVAAVESFHPGFENDDGGFGTVTIDFRDQKVYVEHVNRYTDRKETNYTLKAGDDENLDLLFARHGAGKSGRACLYIMGYGDSGQTEECDPDAKPFEKWAYEFIEREEPGWEINEGGGIELMIDFGQRRVDALIWVNEETESEVVEDEMSFDEVEALLRRNSESEENAEGLSAREGA